MNFVSFKLRSEPERYDMIKVFLKNKISRRIENGHPWIFANEVNTIDGHSEGGEIVEVFLHDKKFIGKGYINPKSQIIVRLLSRNKSETINDDFFSAKLSRQEITKLKLAIQKTVVWCSVKQILFPALS